MIKWDLVKQPGSELVSLMFKFIGGGECQPWVVVAKDMFQGEAWIIVDKLNAYEENKNLL